MNRRTSSTSISRSGSLGGSNSRRHSALVDHERLRPSTEAEHDHEITEAIAEIKRYEDFTTIDWVQDAAREQLRKRAKRQLKAGFFEREGGRGWKRKVWESYDAGQAWIVVSLIGAAIGLNAAFLNIVTEWLADIKLGHCKTGFYLNESFCCWGEEEGKATVCWG
jgi:chloride channel 3/4/5